MATRITKGKFDGLTALADERGVISAVAVDQREWLVKAIAQARGGDKETTADDLTQFKIAVAEVLTKYASGILLDPEYGLPAIRHKSPNVGVLLAYEQTGYDETVEGRLPRLLPLWNVRRLTEAGADAIKVLLYYNPFDKERINAIKHDFVDRVGVECAANDVAFFLERQEHSGNYAARASSRRSNDDAHARVFPHHRQRIQLSFDGQGIEKRASIFERLAQKLGFVPDELAH